MKKISAFITVVTTAVFALVLSVFAIISTVSTTRIIEDDTKTMLTEWSTSWQRKIDSLFIERFAYIKSFKAFIANTVDMETLKDGKSLLEYFKTLDMYTVGLLEQEKFLDIYVWFAPEYTGNVQQYTLQDQNLDGKNE